MVRHCLVTLIFVLSSLMVVAQEFEFQIDMDGNAMYCDSARVLNTNPSLVYKKFAEWFVSQYKGKSDTLYFEQESRENIILKEIVPVSSTSDTTSNAYYISMSIHVEFLYNKISYCIKDIYILSSPEEVPCLNLASSQPSCNFGGTMEDWEVLKTNADRKILALVMRIQEFITS